MAEAPFLGLIRWNDQDEEFFTLFVRADDGEADDGVVIRLLEEFFFTFFPIDTLISRPQSFKIATFLEIVVVIVRWSMTPSGLSHSI